MDCCRIHTHVQFHQTVHCSWTSGVLGPHVWNSIHAMEMLLTSKEIALYSLQFLLVIGFDSIESHGPK